MVISIMAILATLVVQDLSIGKTRAYDANLKSTISSYKQGMELYRARHSTYLVYNHTLGCGPWTTDPSNTFTLKNTGGGTGCTGVHGGGEGKMTRLGGNYGNLAIADVLLSESLISGVYTYPDAKDRTIISNSPSNDFILTLCDIDGTEAKGESTALSYSIYAQLKKPTVQDTALATAGCGGTAGGATGWGDIYSE